MPRRAGLPSEPDNRRPDSCFYTLCEHHGFPFYGVVYVGYISHEHIIGISKLTRLVHVIAKRFSVQERIGQQIADTLNQLLIPHGVAVYIEAHHLCVEMRGVKEMSPITRTTYLARKL